MVDPKPLRPQVPLSFDPRHVALPEENLVRSAGDRHAIFLDRDANERHRPVKPVEPSATPLRIDGHPASFQSARTIGSPPGPEQIYPSTYGNHTRNQARNGLDNDESHHPIRLTRIIQVWIIRPRRGLVRIIRPGGRGGSAGAAFGDTWLRMVPGCVFQFTQTWIFLDGDCGDGFPEGTRAR